MKELVLIFILNSNKYYYLIYAHPFFFTNVLVKCSFSNVSCYM